eukprot:243910-Rhodomonas_salina.2
MLCKTWTLAWILAVLAASLAFPAPSNRTPLLLLVVIGHGVNLLRLHGKSHKSLPGIARLVVHGTRLLDVLLKVNEQVLVVVRHQFLERGQFRRLDLVVGILHP